MRGIVILVFLATFLSPAAGMTGNGLQKFCTASDGTSNSLACTTFVSGFVAGIEAGESSKRKDARMWCFPIGSTIGQARLIIEKYIRDNPQSLHLDAGIIAGRALRAAFPCRISN